MEKYVVLYFMFIFAARSVWKCIWSWFWGSKHLRGYLERGFEPQRFWGGSELGGSEYPHSLENETSYHMLATC